jgi:hypothetical protein
MQIFRFFPESYWIKNIGAGHGGIIPIFSASGRTVDAGGPQALEQPGIHNETLSQTNKKSKTKTKKTLGMGYRVPF